MGGSAKPNPLMRMRGSAKPNALMVAGERSLKAEVRGLFATANGLGSAIRAE
jgi:hypothetical protein